MAKCTLSIGFSGSKQELVSNAENAIKQIGGQFSGNDDMGVFRLPTIIGEVTGNYSLKESAILIEITKKPLMLSCGKIESELRKYLGTE